MIDLLNKKILLITPKYFEYEKYIQLALKKRGAEVTTIIENLDLVNMFYRFVYVYIPTLKEKLNYYYYRKKIGSTDGKFDYVLVIRGSSISVETIQYMKNYINASCTYLMYQWDGIENNQGALNIVDYFDRVYTFDLNDASKNAWKYVPLFYINSLINTKNKKDVDILYIGSVHSNRIEILKNLKKYVKYKNLNLYTHIYIPKLLYYKRKYLSKNTDFSEISSRDLKFKSLSIREVYNLYSRSKIVVDFTHPNQTGFTMRTIECIGNRCKLITNNINIKSADFYRPENIMVYEGTSIDIPDDFLNSKCVEYSKQIQARYSLEGWIDSIFGE